MTRDEIDAIPIVVLLAGVLVTLTSYFLAKPDTVGGIAMMSITAFFVSVVLLPRR